MKHTTNAAGLAIIQQFEGLKLNAYLCPANKWTIGYGSTFYANGTPVKKGDKLTQIEAGFLFKATVQKFENDVNKLVTSAVNQNQFSALVSFAFNVGSDIDADKIPEGLGDSTLLKLVNANPNDPKIAAQFAAWTKATVNGVRQQLPGLVKRRAMECKLYFTNK